MKFIDLQKSKAYSIFFVCLLVGFFFGHFIPKRSEYNYKREILHLQNTIELLENNNKVLQDELKKVEYYQIDLNNIFSLDNWQEDAVVLEKELFSKMLLQQIDLYILYRDLRDYVYLNRKFADIMENEYKDKVKKVHEWLKQPDEYSKDKYYLENEKEIKKGIFYIVYKLNMNFYNLLVGYETLDDTIIGLKRIDYLLVYVLENDK